MQWFIRTWQTVKNNNNIKSILWWGIGIGLVIGCTFNRFSGYDWIVCFRPQALEVNRYLILNPMWTYLPLYPIALLPERLSLASFLMINLIALYLSTRMIKVNRFFLLLSFPCFWIFWYGQLDILVMFGAILGYWSIENKKPILIGLAILLLLIKPHIGGPLALTYIFWSRNWKTMATICVVFLLSLIVWGFQWPLDWINNLLQANTEWRQQQNANIGLFPFGLVSWLGLFIKMPRSEKALYISCATIASLSYVGTYSLIILLIFQIPWWAYLLSSTPYFLGQNGYWITSLVPLFVMIWLIIRNTRIRQYLLVIMDKTQVIFTSAKAQTKE